MQAGLHSSRTVNIRGSATSIKYTCEDTKTCNGPTSAQNPILLTVVTMPSTTWFLKGLNTIALYLILYSANPVFDCRTPCPISTISMTEIIYPNRPEHVPSTSSYNLRSRNFLIAGPKYCGCRLIVCVNCFCCETKLRGRTFCIYDLELDCFGVDLQVKK
jgi:hypothetical protein